MTTAACTSPTGATSAWLSSTPMEDSSKNIRGEATDSKWADAFLDINVEEAKARAKSDMAPDIDFFNDDPHEESSHIEKYFWAPTSVKLDDEGRLYVTESNRHRVQIYRRNGG